MEDGGSGRLSRWTGGPRPEEGRESGAKSSAAQSKGGGWEGSRDMEGEGEGYIKQLKKWDGDR